MALRESGLVPYPNPFWSRAVSFVLAVALTVLILIYPGVIAKSATEVRHGLLSLMMWGMAAGFVHGVGFVPRAVPWRVLFHPALGWPLMLGGLGLIVS